MDRDRHSRSAYGADPHSRVELLGDPGSGRLGSGEDLHICPECASRMVQPVEWAPVDMRRWRVERRCPECEWESVGVHPQHVLDRYDAVLDDGSAALIDDLARLERANMEDQIDRFVGALNAGQVLPEDF